MPTEVDDNTLIVNELKKYYGDVKAVDGISFRIHKGEVYGLLGPNGAGKTTTIKCILGLVSIENGEIRVLGFDPNESPRDVKERIGYVSEEPLLYKSMTPQELFDFVASIRKMDQDRATTRSRELLESLDAIQYYKTAIATLSKGNIQKVQLISALLHDPPLLVLDEPLSGLDAKSSRIVKDLIQLHVESGGAVLLSTHVMEQASALCSRIGIINKGKLVAEGTLDELRSFANDAGASLEEIFLKFTEQDQAVKDVIEKLRNVYHSRRA